MKKSIFAKRFKEGFKNRITDLACIFMIILLTGACAGSDKMQASADDKSKLSPIVGDQTIECRRRATTGSRFKRKICKTKAQWAREDHSKQKTAEQLQKDTDRNYSRQNTGSSDPMGGSFPGASVPR